MGLFYEYLIDKRRISRYIDVRAYILSNNDDGGNSMEMIHVGHPARRREITAVQFGEGNFLRAFVDWMIDVANEAGVCDEGIAIVKPIPFGSLERLREQDCVYTVNLRGKQDGRTVDEHRVITSVQAAVDCYGEYEAFMALARLDTLRFVVSNTTEAGIIYDEADRLEDSPPNSYPGKLTKFLYERYKTFAGDAGKGLMILPVELIEENGGKLRDCVLRLAARWELPEEFVQWVKHCNRFCNTLVDRIVTGYPAAEADALCERWGYRDNLIVTGEPFALWVIESDDPAAIQAALPLDRAGLPVVFTDNMKPYRERKVRILNGGHTGTVLGAYLAGLDTVGECMADPVVRPFLERMLGEEIAPQVRLPKEEVAAFAASVLERFENPFIRHELLSIALNSVSKWKVRILPSLLDYIESRGTLPPLLTFSFAALIRFYRSSEKGDGCLTGQREGNTYRIVDDAQVLSFFAEHAGMDNRDYAAACCGNAAFWGRALDMAGFCDQVTHRLDRMDAVGVKAAMKEAVEG